MALMKMSLIFFKYLSNLYILKQAADQKSDLSKKCLAKDRKRLKQTARERRKLNDRRYLMWIQEATLTSQVHSTTDGQQVALDDGYMNM